MERPETACEDSGRVGGETISERPEEVGNSNRPQGNESPERYSISFRLYIQTIRRGGSNRMERDPIRWGRSVLGSPSHPEG